MDDFMSKFEAWKNGVKTALSVDLPKVAEVVQEVKTELPTVVQQASTDIQAVASAITSDVKTVVDETATKAEEVVQTVAPEFENMMRFFDERISALETLVTAMRAKLYPHDVQG